MIFVDVKIIENCRFWSCCQTGPFGWGTADHVWHAELYLTVRIYIYIYIYMEFIEMREGKFR